MLANRHSGVAGWMSRVFVGLGVVLSAVFASPGATSTVVGTATAAAEPTFGPGNGFSFVAFECPEPAAGFFIDGEALAEAERQVPDSFDVLLDPLGRATLVVAAANCGGTEINGKPAGPALLSDVGIVINSPDPTEPAGQHIYQLWQLTTNHELRQQMKRVGMFGGLTSEATFDQLPEVAPVQFTADFASWEYSPYLLRLAASPPVPVPPGSNTWWHLGNRGPIRIRYSFPDAEAIPGLATINAAAASPLARLLGVEERVADIGAINVHHRYEGTVELVTIGNE